VLDGPDQVRVLVAQKRTCSGASPSIDDAAMIGDEERIRERAVGTVGRTSKAASGKRARSPHRRGRRDRLPEDVSDAAVLRHGVPTGCSNG
jgi:hypothetical protein